MITPPPMMTDEFISGGDPKKPWQSVYRVYVMKTESGWRAKILERAELGVITHRVGNHPYGDGDTTTMIRGNSIGSNRLFRTRMGAVRVAERLCRRSWKQNAIRETNRWERA